MPVIPEDFLAFAESTDIYSSEINARSAASRAYYAAFHICKSFSANLPFPNSDPRGSHETVIHKLKAHEDGKVRKAGMLLFLCRDIRCDADYQLAKHFEQYDAQRCISKVKEIIKTIQE